jgi:hypothetical protein
VDTKKLVVKVYLQNLYEIIATRLRSAGLWSSPCGNW